MRTIAIVAIAFVLAGCAAANESAASSFIITLPDNRTVTCVQISGTGITCDWERAR